MTIKIELKDWLNSINQTKNNLIDEDLTLEKDYSPYIINRCLSGNLDCIFFANAMNQYPFLSKKMQYDFYINSLRKSKRYSPWIKKNKIEDLDYIKKYYGYNDEKSQQALKILTQEQLNFIKEKFDVGGNK